MSEKDKPKKRPVPTVKRPVQKPPMQIQTVTADEDVFETAPTVQRQPVPPPPAAIPAAMVSNERIPTVSRPQSDMFNYGFGREMDVTDPNLPANNPMPSNIPSVGPAILSQRDALEQQRRELQQPVTESKDSRWRSALEAIGESLRYFSPQYGAINSWGDLVARAGVIPGAAIGGAIRPTWDEERDNAKELDRVNQQLGDLTAAEDRQFAQDYKRKQMENIDFDNQLKGGELFERVRANREREEGRKLDRASKERISGVNTALKMWQSLPNFDPNDPKAANLVSMMQEYGLPITAKDAKKNIKQIQDARTGAWTLVLTDPVSGQQEVRPINGQDGKPLVTTPEVQISAEAAAGRQATQNNFTASENAKSRANAQETNAWNAMNDYFDAQRKTATDRGLPFTEPTKEQMRAKYNEFLGTRR